MDEARIEALSDCGKGWSVPITRIAVEGLAVEEPVPSTHGELARARLHEASGAPTRYRAVAVCTVQTWQLTRRAESTTAVLDAFEADEARG